MHKRFVTTILTCILSAVCIFGFTACGDNEDNTEGTKGEQVTEEQWKAAFEATLTATNITIESSINAFYTDKTTNDKGEVVTSTETRNISDLVYINNDRGYYKETWHTKTTGFEDVYGESDYETESIREIYSLVEGTDVWGCDLYTRKYVSGKTENYIEEEPEWDVYKREYDDVETAKKELLTSYSIFEIDLLVDKDATEGKILAELYSAFTYSDGKYSAILFYIEDGLDWEITCDVSVKDGYLVELVMYYVGESTSDEIITTTENKETYIFKEFGKTTVPALPAGAIEALNKAKAEQ